MRYQRRIGSPATAAVLKAAALLLPAACAGFVPATAGADGPSAVSTRLRLSTGYDTFLQTYHLATTDTTETIGEFNVAAAAEARSSRQTAHQWHLRGEVTAGSQLWRELVDLGYGWRPGGGEPRLRADATWTGRQYRQGSDYALSSDHHESRGELRLYPWRGERTGLDLRLRARRLDHSRPSALEQDQRELGAAAYLTSHRTLANAWRLGALAARRAYPDSAAIDRTVLGGEGDWERSGASGDIWLYHRSERRRIAEPEVRPSAWLHWSELRLTTPAGQGHVVANLNSEVWSYDRQTTIWFDAWRLDMELGRRWGDPLSTQKHVLVTLQRLAAGDSPEAHTQVGLRGSIEGYASRWNGIVSVELGRRWYRNQPASDTQDDPFDPDLLDGLLLSYSDFTYLEIWIMATWELSARLSLELTASYQPERHTERTDDTVLGYGSLRLAWRP